MPGSWNRSITDAEVARIATEIDRRGYSTINNFVSDAELKPIRAIARAAVEEAGGEFVFIRGTDDFAGTVLSELPQSAAFKDLCRRLYELEVGKTAPEVKFYQTFRCLRGTTGQSRRHSYAFHYDGFILTALLAVAVPEEGLRGDLVIVPNARGIRRSYPLSALENFLIKTPLANFILRAVTRRRILETVAIKLQPGNMYFFWGYRSLHANAAIGERALRVTALFHYGDPYQNDKISKLLRRTKHHTTYRS